MALRAGYHGVKRNITDELKKLDGILPGNVSKDNKVATQAEINNIWVTQGYQGAKNLLDTTNILKLYIDTTNNKYATQGTPNLCVAKVKPNTKYIITKQAGSTFRVAVSSEYPANDVAIDGTIANHTGTEIVYVTGEHDNYLGVYTSEEDFPTCMVRPAVDTDPTYQPYAKTNQELTASAADQKTAINAIITAATGAADFAAFKTAMGAITPVTRSIQVTPETREEIIEPDEEPVKKTTRKKSTAKADTEKEGE